MPPHPLINQPKFSGFYSRNNLPKTQDGAYVINLDEYESIGTHWMTLYVNVNNTAYFDSFGVEHISKQIKNSLEIKILQQMFIESKNTIQ